MMTAGPVLNVELPCSRLYQQSDFHIRARGQSSDSNKELLSDMACHRRLVSTTESEDESVDFMQRLGRFSSNEDDKNSMNDLNKARKKLISDTYALSLQHATHGQFPLGLTSPDSMEFNGPTPTLTSPNDPMRCSTNGKDLSARNPPYKNPQSFFDDDDDDSWKICGVCNDKATGYHFNALTCEGCKGFFRRSVKNGKAFSCSYSNQCSITKNNRRQCQACRLRKCIEIGMKRECIMSPDQIQQKKSLVLTNRIKRALQQWIPTEPDDEQRVLLNVITSAFLESNNSPDLKEIRGKDAVVQNATSPPNSPASSASSTSHFIDLIKQMSQEIAARTPSNVTGSLTNADHVLHFTDIMEFSIKEVIKFCKKIPTFMDVDLKDQISLLKAGCTEILFLKANCTYDIERKALTLGPDIFYTRESFLQGGMSETYTDYYLKFHEDLGRLHLDHTEMASLSAIALFSADRTDVVDQQRIEKQQQVIACALQAHTDSSYRSRNRFASMMSFLPRLRTLNVLCTHAFSEIQKTFGDDIKPLVMEVQPDDDC